MKPPANFASINKRLGKKIRKLRLAKGWTPEDLASRSDLLPSYISRLENGNANPTLNTILALARVLKTSTDLLLKGIDRRR